MSQHARIKDGGEVVQIAGDQITHHHHYGPGQAAPGATVESVGTPLAEVADPFSLEVHRSITPDGAGELPPLPLYVRRAHDDRLGEVVARAAAGRSGIAVLVAGASAGKTRACWEALHLLREQPEEWRLWHPFDPARTEAAVQALDQVGPRTVVWLNETQEYLGGGEAGERVAAKLRSLLADLDRAPVLVLGTLWPEHHASLTGCPSSQVRQVLDGKVIEVPDMFVGSDLAAMRQAAEADARLAQAVERAEDGQITQYLAGGPALVERFRAAPPAAKAVIWAAMDARRMGHRKVLPLALLEEAAPAYLTDIQYERLGEDWLEQALAYTSQSCKGARGPVTRIRPDRFGRRTVSTGAADEVAGGPVWRLSDFLEQHGRRHRSHQVPREGLWTALASHAHPDDLRQLGDAARVRGLYRHAAHLYKRAVTERGDLSAATYVVRILHDLAPTDLRPACWAAELVALDDPQGVAILLRDLREVGAQEQINMLLERNPAAQVTPDHPEGVAILLKALWEVKAPAQVAALATRAAAHSDLNQPHEHLEEALWEVGALAQLRAVVERAGPREPVRAGILGGRRRGDGRIRGRRLDVLDHLLIALRQGGGRDQVTAVATRVVALVALDDPQGVAILLRDLREVGAQEQINMLLERDPAAQVTLDDPTKVVELLEALGEVDARDQIAALTSRLPAAGLFQLFIRENGNQSRFRFGRDVDGHPTEPWDWDDLTDATGSP